MKLRNLDRAGLAVAVVLLVSLSWFYLADMARMMAGMPMDAGAMQGGAMTGGVMDSAPAGNMADAMKMVSAKPWSPAAFTNMLIMWTIMMIAMMVPTAARTLMIFARVAGARSDSLVSPTYSFLGGYIVAWTGFSLGATLLQWQLDEARLLSPMMVSTSYYLGAILLLVAGIYQFTPIKNACLSHCQSPMFFISNHFRPGHRGALTMGLHHGLYCVGCCWALMLLLFVAGVMNLLWILLITLFVLVEKLLPVISPRLAAVSTWVSGAGLLLAGMWMLLNT